MTRDEAVKRVRDIRVGDQIMFDMFLSQAWVDALIALDLLRVEPPPPPMPLGYTLIEYWAGSENGRNIMQALSNAGLTIVKKDPSK